MLRGARRLAPHVEPWLHCCFGQAVPLYSQGQQVSESVTGVHQGDALGPLGFALGLEEALEAAGNAGHAEMGWESWYLDDWTLIGLTDGLATLI